MIIIIYLLLTYQLQLLDRHFHHVILIIIHYLLITNLFALNLLLTSTLSTNQ